ncbi:MAG: sodium-dependent transporter, partial [Candidatus Neomarinimicrobiota bacterium]
MTKPREHWGSKFGFILAAAGSAVGLGNIWKYPHMAGQNGGGAFTMVYLICILVVGLPILLAEISIGRRTQLNPVGAFKSLSNNSNWKFVGILGVASAFVILSFYSVVGGWTLKYAFLALMGTFNEFSAGQGAGEAFNRFIANPIEPVFWHLVFMGLCILIIAQGVKAGIERWSKILMPILLAILLLLVFRGITLDGAGEGLRFLFSPKWSDLNASSIVLALGHSFFTISLGMGTMITYGSYLDKKSDLLQSALWVVGLDTAIALLAGIAIFTAVFALGQNPAAGPGLIFVVLPSLFPSMAGGAFFGVMFFFLLFVAALTSAISILEVVTAYFIDEKGWSRSKATFTFGGIIGAIGVLASLSNGSYNILSPITDMTFMDLIDKASSKYMLPLGGMLTAVFVLVRWGISRFVDEMHVGAAWFKFSKPAVTAI